MHESEYEYATTIIGYKVGVNKVGGGTVGKSYDREQWIVTVHDGHNYLFKNEILNTGTHTDHMRAAKLAVSFAHTGLDS